MRLADERTRNLDEKPGKGIMGLLREINGTRGVTIRMVTHTTQLVSYGTRAIEMAGGAIRDGKAFAKN